MLTEAVRGENVPELWEKIEEHRAFLEQSGRLEERRRREPRARGLRGRVERGRSRTSSGRWPTTPSCGGCSTRCRRRELDPLTAVREILEKVFRQMATETAPGLS